MLRFKQRSIIFLLFCLLPICSQANESRIALVIGNSAYTNSPLKNPSNDAHDMSAQLRNLGFDVVERNNISKGQIGSTLREFRTKLNPGAVALIFYAGHGIQIKGENYLPAVDAEIITEEDVSNQSISVRQIMDVLDESKTRLNLVFLDACRNNPYSRSFRSAESGLARVSAPSGTLISYATRPGSVAADGDGRNGLYTSKLLKQLSSNQQIELSLKAVVSEVKAASLGKQEPWMEGSIEGEFCFTVCGGSSQPFKGGAVSPALDPASIELSFWDSIKNSDDPADFRAYLVKYPNGQFEAIAHNRLKSPVPAALSVEQLDSLFKKTIPQDSTPEPVTTRHEPTFTIGSKGPGGGIVFYVDNSGSHGLEAKASDEANKLDWNEAIVAANSYGSGWHLPTKKELNLLCQQKAVIGGFHLGGPYGENTYWSSMESGSNNAWCQVLDDCYQTNLNKSDYVAKVRVISGF